MKSLQKFYTENWETLLREIKSYLNKWTDIS